MEEDQDLILDSGSKGKDVLYSARLGFSDASLHRYKRVWPSIGPSVGWSVGRFVMRFFK